MSDRQMVVSRRLITQAVVCVTSIIGFATSASAVEPAVLEAQSRRIAMIEKVAPAVVAIFASDGQGGGSGVLVSPDGYTVTNFHVVDGQGPFLKCGLNDGRLYDAVLVGIDPTGDVALIKLLDDKVEPAPEGGKSISIPRTDFPAATIGDSDKVRVGDGAYAMGNPFLLAADFKPTVTYGMVSGVHRYQFPAGTFLEYTDCLQVDASINPGNSGGPLFNEDGELIGINGRISVEKRGRVNVGAGYAISINQVMNFLDHLKSGRVVDHATLGAVVSTNSDGSVTVSNILEQSEAFRRGLQVGDELVSFAGRPITTANQFKNILGIYPAGWQLPLSYRRKGMTTDIQVRLRRLHRLAEMPGAGEEEQPQPGPGPVPEGLDQSAGEPPKQYAHMYEAKSGYANYWFNAQAQDRLLAALAPWEDYSKAKGAWKIDGKLETGTPVQFRLTDETIAVKQGDRTGAQQTSEDPGDIPVNTGGWLSAMAAIRTTLVQGRDGFSDCYYLGSEPLDVAGPRVDVLVFVRGQSILRWYFDQQSGECVGVDFSRTEDVDECEIRFSPLKDFGGRKFPETMTVRYATKSVGVFTISAFETQN